MYWIVEPYENSDADYAVFPADNQNDHLDALVYAKARVEDLWDSLEEGESASVTIKLSSGKMPAKEAHDED